MSRKKKKPDTVQATLGDVLTESKSKKTTKKTTKKKPASKSKKKPTPKKETPVAKKETPAKKKAPAKKKTTTKKKQTPKKETPVTPESAFSLKQLPGVGPKLEEKLTKAKYDTVEKISRARSTSIAKKVDGLSKAGAQKLVDAAKDLVKNTNAPSNSTGGVAPLP